MPQKKQQQNTTYAKGTVGHMLSDEQRKVCKTKFLQFKATDSIAVLSAIEAATTDHKDKEKLWMKDIELAVCLLLCLLWATEYP